VSLKLLAGLVACAAPAAARADERAVSAEVAPAVPFDAAQLTDAIRIRLPAGRAPIRVRVFATPVGVRIEARGNARDVALGGLTGTAAARLVALAASDLLLDDLAAAPPAPWGSSAASAPSAPSEIEAQLAPSTARTTFSVLGGASAWPHMLGGASVDVVASTGTWLLAVEAGGGALVDGPLRLMTAMFRIGGGARFGRFELRATATFVPVIVGDGAGDRTILPGIGASARVRIPLAASVSGVIAGGIDLFATRTEYVLQDVPVLTTPRAAPWIAAGVEVTP
jgi:hypothetical protein